VKAPSKGLQSGGLWLPPSATAWIGCGSCHDNGPFIRSPYLNQVTGPNALPGSDDRSFNRDPQPYAFVGEDFASWKAFKVEVSGNECNSCHRLGVNNVKSGGARDPGRGTALDFGIRATAPSETAKNGPTEASCGTEQNPKPTCPSPIWMPPDPVQVKFNKTHKDAAEAIHDCAALYHEDQPLPNLDICRITQFAGAWPRTFCFEIAKCRVHGREVLPTDTDDPKTWCSDIGGRIDHFWKCSTRW
jgi:hypothetical protein